MSTLTQLDVFPIFVAVFEPKEVFTFTERKLAEEKFTKLDTWCEYVPGGENILMTDNRRTAALTEPITYTVTVFAPAQDKAMRGQFRESEKLTAFIKCAVLYSKYVGGDNPAGRQVLVIDTALTEPSHSGETGFDGHLRAEGVLTDNEYASYDLAARALGYPVGSPRIDMV